MPQEDSDVLFLRAAGPDASNKKCYILSYKKTKQS